MEKINLNFNNTGFKPATYTKEQYAASDEFMKCRLKGCMYRAKWMPLLVLSPDGKKCMYQNFGNLMLCEYHKRNIGLSDIVDTPTPHGISAFQSIRNAFIKAHKLPPEREYTKLLWRMV